MQERVEGMLREPKYDLWADGDMSYALMGLLRRRPKVNQWDTDFEAFARLSLANDSNMLLERLICMLPHRRDNKWHTIQDEWGVRLWDIYPTCQIAGIGENQTVILDGAFGATIRWKSLAQVAFIRRNTGMRTFLKFLLRGLPIYFIIGVTTLASGVATPIRGQGLSLAPSSGSSSYYRWFSFSLRHIYFLLRTGESFGALKHGSLVLRAMFPLKPLSNISLESILVA
jgi:hypothetical protein